MEKTGRFRHTSANPRDLASPSRHAPEAVSLNTCGGAVLAEIAAIEPPGIVLAWCYHGTTMVPRWCTDGMGLGAPGTLSCARHCQPGAFWRRHGATPERLPARAQVAQNDELGAQPQAQRARDRGAVFANCHRSASVALASYARRAFAKKTVAFPRKHDSLGLPIHHIA